MNSCYDTLVELSQWHKDVAYVIGIMARRNAYFTEWDVTDIVGPPPTNTCPSVHEHLVRAAMDGKIRDTGRCDTLVDGSKRVIWIGNGVVGKEA